MMPATAEQKLTAEELQQARLFLQQTRDYAIGATKGLSEQHWTFKPAPDQWSIAENMDHILTVQERVLGPILDILANAPAPCGDADPKTVDAIVINRLSVRLAKFPAPEAVRPAGHVSRDETVERLKTNYQRLFETLETRPGLRQHAIDSPPLKAITQGAYVQMDGYQWILAVAAHTERHTKQILEVKAHPDYPA